MEWVVKEQEKSQNDSANKIQIPLSKLMEIVKGRIKSLKIYRSIYEESRYLTDSFLSVLS